jgi:hypothetical protein
LNCALSFTPPIFMGYLSANQSVTDSTFTEMNIGTVVKDTQSWFNTSTHRYTPQLAGTYEVTVGLRCNVATAISACVADVRLNGNAYARKGQNVSASGATADGMVSAMVTLNGTTDFVSGYGFVTGTGGSDVFQGGSGPIVSWMSVKFVAP